MRKHQLMSLQDINLYLKKTKIFISYRWSLARCLSKFFYLAIILQYKYTTMNNCCCTTQKYEVLVLQIFSL